ncbi:hypothetical protein LAZ67_18002015 [Cordylochernes scorpioides]|uniref:Mos1 transposase HTH domain-containing protein n=1 Tax=Cordylochernes scorpioides TaxID=51811 RepID=A0ABY6LGB6_9ARAC|nr:hypothetical protein LAZ67_18002015 [Cordylochernes scorpioides]
MEDQRICIKFCVKNGFKGAEIFWMSQTAYGDAVMSRRRVFEWYKRFKEGREETADNERSERPSTSTTPEKVDKVLELVREDRRITVREVAEEAGISFGSTQSIMKDILGVRRLNAVLVPKDLTFDQKNVRKETASLNLEATTDDPELLKRVITGDETWICGFDSETTQQASEGRFKNEARPKKARKAPSKVMVMLTVFFDYQGIVHHEFQQEGSTITADSYLEVLRRLREAIRQKRPELWRSKSWILHHDNAPAHTALKISKFLQDHSTSVFPQPPYSPDLAPCDFFFFGKLKKVKGSKISEHRRDQSGIEEGHEGDPENRLPEAFGFDGMEEVSLASGRPRAPAFARESASSLPGIPTQWIEREEPKPKKARFTKSKVKTLLVTFFDINGLVHHEFIPFGRTINQEVYLGIMRRLREAVRLKRPERWQNNDWILRVDNARPHTAHVVLQFLAQHSTIQIPHPPYSPDLAPNDFFLYPKLKMKLKGRKFDNVDMIQLESKATLRNLSKSDFISCFDNWKKRWIRCIEAGGAYFEKY